jgi:imidazolonepropionase-like amidohydrolase
VAQAIFSNAKLLLDGFHQMQSGLEVLVEDKLIRVVSAVPLPQTLGITAIDAGQRTLMEGLIDPHAPIMGLSLTPKNIE